MRLSIFNYIYVTLSSGRYSFFSINYVNREQPSSVLISWFVSVFWFLGLSQSVFWLLGLSQSMFWFLGLSLYVGGLYLSVLIFCGLSLWFSINGYCMTFKCHVKSFTLYTIGYDPFCTHYSHKSFYLFCILLGAFSEWAHSMHIFTTLFAMQIPYLNE